MFLSEFEYTWETEFRSGGNSAGRLVFLDRNARFVDAKFDAFRLGFLAINVDAQGNDRDDQSADDEI
jgi:hypothetical protein